MVVNFEVFMVMFIRGVVLLYNFEKNSFLGIKEDIKLSYRVIDIY